jgi:hypothetical protein
VCSDLKDRSGSEGRCPVKDFIDDIAIKKRTSMKRREPLESSHTGLSRYALSDSFYKNRHAVSVVGACANVRKAMNEYQTKLG